MPDRTVYIWASVVNHPETHPNHVDRDAHLSVAKRLSSGLSQGRTKKKIILGLTDGVGSSRSTRVLITSK